ncbi:flavin reductase family protein [Marinococcus luteus]|uniref:flavin reductase family protein n=1 Tax=Marinococcus luteus TaxID=1122204 RepID=UPI002ACCE527|nr:flavin reductase family protein [Marinococcus luteus]MDZ5783963.1 flavin reductase family protein [Marinococcus luteus]
MHELHPDDLPVKEVYKLLTGSVIPRPIAFVTTMAEDETLNAAPFSFFNAVSPDPPVLMISITRKEGKPKDSAKNILDRGELVVHISDEGIVEDLNITAATLPPEENELEHTVLHTVPSKMVEVPGIEEANIRFECRLHKHVPLQNAEGKITQDVIFAEIICIHVSEGVYDSEHNYILPDKLKPVARLAGNDYSKLGELFTLERPK